MLRRLRPFDWFMIINTSALVISVATTWFTAELEFGLYAAVILVAGAVGWRFLRQFDYPLWLLALVQLGIVAHFAGGYVKYGPEGWLYWHYFLGIRYDQIVHFFNSFVALLAIGVILPQADVRMGRVEPFILVMAVFGISAMIEIVEFFAVLTIPNVGVGDYANNMMDLVLNLLGAITGMILLTFLRRRGSVPRAT